MEYKESTETAFDSSNVNENQNNRTATISDLDPDTSYDVRVQATNGEGHRRMVVSGNGLDQQGGQQPSPIER